MVSITRDKKEDESISITFKGNDLCLKLGSGKIIEGVFENIPYLTTKDRKVIRFNPMDYWDVIDALEVGDFQYEPDFNTDFHLEPSFSYRFKPRDYQGNAFEAWKANDSKGVVVLPTGSGKTMVGIMALCESQVTTLVVVPTLDLMQQWRDDIVTHLVINGQGSNRSKVEDVNAFVGFFGGGDHEIAPITITTYSSAYLHLPRFRDRFGLLILDEVHHLPGEKHRFIASGSVAPMRLGLTATLDKSEEIYPVLVQNVGPIIYSLSPRELSDGKRLAPFIHEKIPVYLPADVLDDYNFMKDVYIQYMNQVPGKRDKFRQMLFNVNRDPRAFKALQAYNKAKKIAFNANRKLVALQDILESHPEERILTFSEDISLVERISREFFIPAITSNTPSKERREIIDKFRHGKYRIVASGKVLDEGVNVPEASVGIIVSGTGTPRQFIQRLGRILRPLPGKTAKLYEIVTAGTSEQTISARRSRRTN